VAEEEAVTVVAVVQAVYVVQWDQLVVAVH